METIILKGAQLVTTTAADEARLQRDELMARVRSCPAITDAATHETATDLLRDLRNYYKVIERGREEAKAPVLRIGKEIDALARELSFAVEEHGKSLSIALGAYDMQQKRIAEEARQKAAAEEARIRREAAEKERAEEERQRKLAEQARREVERQKALITKEAEEKAARARTEAGRERAAEEARKRQEELDAKALEEFNANAQRAHEEGLRRDEEEAQRVAAARLSCFVGVPAKPKDTATREEVRYEVTDVVALYEAAPYLVTLTPNVAALKSALKGLRGEQKLPGVKHWFEAVTITR